MRLRPFFSFFGAKWRAVPRYPEPSCPTVIEPFAGAAGYSVRHHEADVTLFDIDPYVVGVWDYLINVPADEVMALPLIEDFSSVDDLTHLSDGARWLIGFWLNPGSSSPRKTPSAWVRDNQAAHPGSIWSPRTRARIASQVDAIRHWTVTLSSYVDILNHEGSWFIDPPYSVAGKSYRFGSQTIDYQHLGAWARERQGQVIVCENEGANWLPFRTLGSIKATAGRRRSGISHEVIWTDDDAQRSRSAVAHGSA